METFYKDIRYGIRTLLKKPAFLSVAVLTLALGIGANTAIFTTVNSILLRPLPFVDSQSLVTIYGGSARNTIINGNHSYPDFLDYKNQSQTLSHVIAYDNSGSIIAGADGETEQIRGSDISAEVFDMLGVKPMLGRLFTQDEDQPGGPSIMLLSHGLWERRFNSDNDIVGKDVRFGVTGRTVTVIGVMPEGFKFPVDVERSDYWMPFTTETARYYDNSFPDRDSRGIPLLGKLKPGVSIQQAQAEMEAITNQLETQYPESNTGRRVRLVPLQEEITGNIRPALLVLLCAVGFVLLIACANIANLTLARATVRSKEMAIRAALGASRQRIIRQLLTESVLVAFCGGLFGLLLALWGVDLFKAAAPADIPRVAEISLDYRVLFFAFSLSLLTGLICGLAPAMQASKTDLNEALKEGGKGTNEGSRRNRLRGLLIVSEVALSLVLLISAGLLLRSFVRLLNNQTGYTAAGVLTIDVPLSRTRYPKPEHQRQFFEQAIERVKSLAGVDAVGATNLLPLSNIDTRITLNIEGRPPAGPGERLSARDHSVTPDYFRALNIPVREGRPFADTDNEHAPPVIIINEAFARSYFNGEEPLGKRILIDGPDDQPSSPREVVGIVGNVRHSSLDDEESREMYVPFSQAPIRRMIMVARTAENAAARLAPAVREVIRELDKDQVIWELKTMNERVALSVAPRRFNTMLLALFAAVALLMASVGIYGVMAYFVTERRREIGIRLALGATAGDILRMVIKQGMAMALAGIGVGLVAAFALTRLLERLLFGVSTMDVATFAVVSLILTGVALAACFVPARRATKVDPMVALRNE